MTQTQQPLAAPGDPELLAAYLRHPQDGAFARIVEKHGGMVLTVCRSVLHNESDAQDAAQAVFLTLARKASSLQRHKTLVGWLHRVAWYIAARARKAAAVRQKHEREAARMKQELTGPGEAIPLDVLHAELSGLPEKYHLAILLHHIEGKTQEETAAALGCTPSAASVRLTRGRQLLRDRLLRRGITASAVVLVATLASQSPAAVLPAFVTTANQTALAVVAGNTVVASASAAALSKGALHMLFWTKLKLAAVVASAVILAGGVGVATYVIAADTTSKPAATVDNAKKAKLIETANEEAKKAYRKQAGLKDDADVGQFNAAGDSTYGLVAETVVTPKGDGWNVTMTKKIPADPEPRIVVRAIVNLDKDGKLVGEVKFEGTAKPMPKPKGNT